MSVRESNARAAAKETKTEPKRIRVNVPLADESVLAWFEIQENHSLSVRQLIREHIERHGYVDVVNRPVAQLPKRGRPSGQGEWIQVTTAEEHLARVAVETARIKSFADEARAQSEPGLAELDLSEPESSGPELLGIALQAPALAGAVLPPATGEPAPIGTPEPAPAPSGQVDVNDLMSALR